MHCPSCQQPTPEGAAFCGHCGTRLTGANCRRCAAPLAGSEAYCSHCGAPVTPEEATTVPERLAAFLHARSEAAGAADPAAAATPKAAEPAAATPKSAWQAEFSEATTQPWADEAPAVRPRRRMVPLIAATLAVALVAGAASVYLGDEEPEFAAIGPGAAGPADAPLPITPSPENTDAQAERSEQDATPPALADDTPPTVPERKVRAVADAEKETDGKPAAPTGSAGAERASRKATEAAPEKRDKAHEPAAPPPRPVVAQAVARGEKAQGWHQALQRELAVCAEMAFFQRVFCREKARWRYCEPGRWDKVPECRLNSRPAE